MRLAYTTTFAAKDVHNWSGTPFHMSHHFAKQGCSLEYIGPLKRKLPPFFKLKQVVSKYLYAQRESPRFNVYVAKRYSQQLAQQLHGKNIDAILSPQINPIAYLETKQPLVLWTDAVYAALVGFYSPFGTHSQRTIQQGNEITRACLERCQLTIFSSDWAAESARQLYDVPENKIKVIPFGANINEYPDQEEVHSIIAKRSNSKIKLLFLAKSWERKGGDLVLEVTHALHAAGYPVELTIVGIKPTLKREYSYIKCLGFVSKNTQAGKLKFKQILAETHFLFVPSRAEAYGIVFCEANAYAIPCITTDVGGISTIIKDDINGKKFAIDASVEDYCNYITTAANTTTYQNLAKNSYREFLTRLNWPTAIQTAKQYIQDLL